MGSKANTKPKPPRHPLVERMQTGRRYRLDELRQLARALNPDIPKARFKALVGALTAEGQLVRSGQRAGARWRLSDAP